MIFGSHSAHSSPIQAAGAVSGQPMIYFDVFAVDPATGELFRQGQRVMLPNQSFLALTAMLERPGELVSREELRARLWPDKRVVEFEQGLNAVINRLRDALGDSAGQPRFIETLPRRGYRFICAVTAGAASTPVAPAASAVPPGTASVDTSVPPYTPAHKPARARAAPLPLYALGALVAALVLAITLMRWQSPPDDARAYANSTIHRLTSSVGREVSPSFAPDGRSFVFGWNGGADNDRLFDLYIKKLDSEHLFRLTHAPAIAISPAWSPGGEQIAFARVSAAESGIYSVPATGAAERLLTPASFLDESFMQVSWSADGRSLAYSAVGAGASSSIHVLTLDNLSKRELQRPDGCIDAGIPTFAPDDLRLAYVCTASLAVYSVYVIDTPAANPRPSATSAVPREGTPRLLATLQGNPRGMTWSADGRELILSNDAGDGSALWLLTLTGALTRVPGTEESLGPGLATTPSRPPTTVGMATTSPGSATTLRGIAFVREQQRYELSRITLTSVVDSGASVVAAASRSQLVPQYSPDGAHVVFQSERSGHPEIWLSDSDGRNPIQLTAFNGPQTGGPSWCSDGRRIAFDSRASGTSLIYLMDVLDGPSHPLDTSQGNLSLPVWSQDCRWIFASNGRTTLYRVPAAGGVAERFTQKRAYRAAVSGDRVIFNVATAEGVQLWSQPARGGQEQALENMPLLRYSDAWCAARDGIYYAIGGARLPLINFYDFASHRTRLVRTSPEAPAALGGLGMTVSPDGRWLLYTHSADWQGDIMLISGQRK